MKQTIILSGAVLAFSLLFGASYAKAEDPAASDAPVVYFTSDISAEGLVRAYEKLGWQPQGNVAVKITTGEPPASNYLRPELLGDLVKKINGTLVECNTAYGGSRNESAMHHQVAKDHGYTKIAKFDLLDEDGEMLIPINLPAGMTPHFENDVVGSHFANYDSCLVVSHFKGHILAGYGGAIKNISIGLGSPKGKCLIHTGGKSDESIWNGDQTDFTESMAETGKAVSDYLGNGKRIAYINVMNRLSIDCDCDGNPAEPDIHDIGILSSCDPVALDQACLDLIYRAEGNAALVRRIEERNAIHTVEHAAKIGLGRRDYRLVNIDE